METLDIVKTAKTALEDRKAEDISIIDIREISTIADYFVIATGANQNQLNAMGDAVEEALGKLGVSLRHVEGTRSSSWILMDYRDVIVHLFSREDREFYDIERIWTDGKKIEV